MTTVLPTTLFHRTYSSNGNIKILGSRGKDDDEEKEKEKEEEEEEEEDEPVVKKGRGFVEKQEDVVMFEPPKESGRGWQFVHLARGSRGVASRDGERYVWASGCCEAISGV